jgi:hypothetical protein
MNIEKVVLDELGKEFSEAMDFEILSDVMCRFGWTRVEIPRFIDNYHAVDIGYWLADNCQGEYKRNGRHFLFESTKDATMFILRWS